MKHLLYLPLVLLASCTVIHGDRNKGTYTLATVGGDVTEMAQTAEGYTAASLDNSKSFKEVAAAAKAQIWAGALKSVASTAGSTYQGITKAKEGTARIGLRETGLTDRARIAGDVEKTRIASSPFAQ